MFRFEMVAKIQFSFKTKKVTWPKFEKKNYHKDFFFFNKIWFKVNEHEYIYFSELKFGKQNKTKQNTDSVQNGTQNKFCDIAQ